MNKHTYDLFLLILVINKRMTFYYTLYSCFLLLKNVSWVTLKYDRYNKSVYLEYYNFISKIIKRNQLYVELISMKNNCKLIPHLYDKILLLILKFYVITAHLKIDILTVTGV